MSVSLNSLSIDQLESWRTLLNILLLLSTAAVVIGVYFERDICPDDTKRYGASLVFRGVAGELLFAALLWQADVAIGFKQNLEIQALRADNLKLAAEIQPRRLSGDNVANIVKILSTSPPEPIAIVSRLMDAEGKDFGDDLAAAFTKGSWQTARYENWLRSDKGVFVATVEGTQLPPGVSDVLKAALGTANVKYETITISTDDHTMSPPFQAHVLYLLIGQKP